MNIDSEYSFDASDIDPLAEVLYAQVLIMLGNPATTPVHPLTINNGVAEWTTTISKAQTHIEGFETFGNRRFDLYFDTSTETPQLLTAAIAIKQRRNRREPVYIGRTYHPDDRSYYWYTTNNPDIDRTLDDLTQIGFGLQISTVEIIFDLSQISELPHRLNMVNSVAP